MGNNQHICGMRKKKNRKFQLNEVEHPLKRLPPPSSNRLNNSSLKKLETIALCKYVNVTK